MSHNVNTNTVYRNLVVVGQSGDLSIGNGVRLDLIRAIPSQNLVEQLKCVHRTVNDSSVTQLRNHC